MKAIVYNGNYNVQLEDVLEPALGANDIKVSIHFCGICGTDIHKYKGKSGSRPVIPPVILGHEVSGVVSEIGQSVHAFSVGDRVTVDPNWHCGICDFCHNGQVHMCENSKGVVKGMADIICSPQENVYKLPDSLPMLEAALTEPLSCCIHGIDLLNMKSGGTVCIIGFGSIGLMMLQLCKAQDISKIIVVDVDSNKKESALNLGATHFINSNNEDVHNSLLENNITHLDYIIECVGFSSTIESAIALAGKKTKVLLFGVGSKDDTATFNTYRLFQNEITIIGSFINPNTTQRAIDMLDSGLINTDAIISSVISMEDAPHEIRTQELMKSGKVIVRVSDKN